MVDIVEITKEKGAGLNVCIVGGGNSTHTLIPLLSTTGHTVTLLTRHPGSWNETVIMEYTGPDGNKISELSGKLTKASDQPEQLIPEADIVLFSLPVSKYRLMLDKVAPYINSQKKVFIGTIYGQGGFNWMVEKIKSEYHLLNLSYFAVGLLPWITRTKEYGVSGYNFGPKAVNVVAISPPSDFFYLNDNFLNDVCFSYFKTGKFVQSQTFLALTLSVDNQIIHLARLYSLYKEYGGIWDSKDNIPLFYKDFDDNSADMMQKLDRDYTKIRQQICQNYPNLDFSYMLDYLQLERFSYNSVNTSIKESFINSKTLNQIETPTVLNKDGKYIINKEHRFFTDDLYYGLVIAKWFSEHYALETSTIDEIINWAQGFIGDTVMVDNRLCFDKVKFMGDYKYGHPSIYNLASFDDYIV